MLSIVDDNVCKDVRVVQKLPWLYLMLFRCHSRFSWLGLGDDVLLLWWRDDSPSSLIGGQCLHTDVIDRVRVESLKHHNVLLRFSVSPSLASVCINSTVPQFDARVEAGMFIVNFKADGVPENTQYMVSKEKVKQEKNGF